MQRRRNQTKKPTESEAKTSPDKAASAAIVCMIGKVIMDANHEPNGCFLRSTKQQQSPAEQSEANGISIDHGNANKAQLTMLRTKIKRTIGNHGNESKKLCASTTDHINNQTSKKKHRTRFPDDKLNQTDQQQQSKLTSMI